MSGFEVAGLVLAVFPVVVNGLQQFTEGVETIKNWKRYQRELAKYSRTLETQRIVYLNTIERLFEGIIQSNDELEELMQDPAAAFLDKPQYEDSLKTRLGRSYSNYMLMMQDLIAALTKLRGELGISVQGELLWNGLPALERHVKRLKLVLSKNTYTDVFTQIDKANKQLNDYVKEARVLEIARSKRRPSRSSVNLDVIRRNARSLYNVLVTGRAWNCACWKNHRASLRLELRSWEDVTDKEKACEAANIRFRVLLAKEHPDEEPNTLWSWQEIEVAPVEISAGAIIKTDDESQSPRLTTLSVVQSSKPSIKKRAVSFAPTVTDSASKLLWPDTSPIASSPALAPITDICIATNPTKPHTMIGVKKEIGFLVDETAGKIRHDIYFVDDKVRSASPAQSLERLLEVSQQHTSGLSFSRCDRLCIAVTLASSVLQLDGTFWLKKRWRSGDIIFLPTEEPKLLKPRFDYSHPHISWNVLANDENTKSVPEEENASFPRQIRNECLFALGVTLIELSLKRNLSDLLVPEDGPPFETTTLFNAATRLIDNVYEESGTRYGDAVQRCLICPFNLQNLRDFSFDNKEFQEAIYDHVFAPLRQDFEDFNGTQRIQ